MVGQAVPQQHSDSVDITFYVPCLNEERNVPGTLDVIGKAVAATGVSYEILVVDDGSTDRTSAVVESFGAAHPDVPLRLIRNPRTQGVGYNFAAGARVGRGKYYMLVNGDNVERVEVLTALLGRLGQADILIPYFGRLDQRPLARRLVSRAFARLVNVLSGTKVHYYNGAVVHLRENVVRWHPGTRGFAYQAELITRLIRHGASYIEMEVPGQERQQGASKAFRLRNFLSVSGSLARILLRRLIGDKRQC
jgi:dolichol-phosphate mannosyltransferase